MEIEDDDDYDSMYGDMDDDDTSWRVRRAAIKLIETLINHHKDKIKEISAESILPLVSL